MGKIVLLDDLTINQIAAGEVIERPASVVKELVENSIDAGATSISVEVKNGGIKQIKIIDNGSGISKDDLNFAFERHATSKIRTADDLETVKSMGFRGEALASIAAIAHVEVVTKTADDFAGNKIVLEGGDILEQEEVGAQKGTTITVSNLFYNTPVRYKFLKKDYTELGYIEDAIKRIALANPNVAIRLLNENKTMIKTTGNGELKTAVYNLFGKETTDGIIDIDYMYEDIKVTGAIGKPEIARGNRSYQLFFVNRRFIKDKTLSAGAEQAFKGLLPIGKYGFVILNIEMDPKKIDVNVHPAKLEIRFQEEQKIFKAVYHAIREGLLKGDLIRNPEKAEENNLFNIKLQENKSSIGNIKLQESGITNIKPQENSIANVMAQESSIVNVKPQENSLASIILQENGILSAETQEKSIMNIEGKHDLVQKVDEAKTDIEEKQDKVNSEMQETQRFTPIIEETKEAKKTGLFSIFKKKNSEIEENVEKNAIEEIFSYKNNETYTSDVNEENTNEAEKKHNEEFKKMYSETFGVKKEDNENDAEKITNYSFANVDNMSLFEESEEYNQIPPYKYCGSVFSTYIIIEMGNEMYIIDQHAAHERVMYEEIKNNYYRIAEKDSQIMLLPDIITLSHKEKSIVKENIDLFRKAGFMLEEFGENTVRLVGVPSICIEMDTKELFLEILDTIDTVAITAKQEKEDKFIATIACKAAVKANMALTKEEVDNLMKKLLVLPNPFTCPHGRPTAIKMDKMDIERKFNRRK